MSLLLLTPNRFYLKFSTAILHRHLSTSSKQILPRHLLTSIRAAQKKNTAIVAHEILFQKRSFTVESGEQEKERQTPTREQNRGFNFPPGNPSDKPRLEHLKFIENELIICLTNFFKSMHPYGLYTSDVIFENNYDDPAKIIKGAGGYALALFWIRTKLNFKLMSIKVNLLKTTVDEESNCVKIRWRISGLSNKSFVGLLRGWRKPRDVRENIRQYIEHIDGLSTFYVRGDGRIFKHRIDRMMVDEDKQEATTPLSKKKIPATAPIS